jgi:hypothetical protein
VDPLVNIQVQMLFSAPYSLTPSVYTTTNNTQARNIWSKENNDFPDIKVIKRTINTE